MRPAAHFAIALGLAACLTQRALGQAAWEYTPYKASLWVVAAPVPQLTTSVIDHATTIVEARSQVSFGPILSLQSVPPPPALAANVRHDFAHLTVAQIESHATTDDFKADKIYIAFIGCRAGEFNLGLCEFDCRTRQLGPRSERRCATVGELPLALWDALAESFTPLARIEQSPSGHITARLRAAGLAIAETSPALVQPGMVLRPILRRNDRTGQPIKNGILAVGWTYFTVTERHGATIEGEQQSGYRQAIPARGGIRLERLALLVRPRHKETRLELRSRTETAKPLIGYEIHRRIDNTGKTELVGVTDSEGSLTLAAANDGRLETYIVKNGKQLLARLPVVPGYEATLTAYVADDDSRLAAEGVVAALSSRALDLVARREVLAARIRARLKEGKSAEAQQLLAEFRRLASRAELARELDRFRQQITSRDKTTQSRIDRIFADGQRLLLLKPLSDELLAQLNREVSAAGSGSEASKT